MRPKTPTGIVRPYSRARGAVRADRGGRATAGATDLSWASVEARRAVGRADPHGWCIPYLRAHVGIPLTRPQHGVPREKHRHSRARDVNPGVIDLLPVDV